MMKYGNVKRDTGIYDCPKCGNIMCVHPVDGVSDIRTCSCCGSIINLDHYKKFYKTESIKEFFLLIKVLFLLLIYGFPILKPEFLIFGGNLYFYYEDNDSEDLLPSWIKKIRRFVYRRRDKGKNTIRVPKGVTIIGEGAFESTCDVKEIVLPKSLRKIKTKCSLRTRLISLSII